MKKTTVVEEGDNVHHVTTQNVDEVLKYAKDMRELQKGPCKDMHLAAAIPETLIQNLINTGKLTRMWSADREQIARLHAIIKRDYPHLICTPKNIVFKGK